MSTQFIQRPTTTEILKAIGATSIITPAKMGKHHLTCGASFKNEMQRVLVVVLSVRNGYEYLKQIESTYDLQCETDSLAGRAGDYYELDASQVVALNAALSA